MNIKLISINTEKITIAKAIPIPPEVGLGVKCIPLFDGYAIAQGYLIKKYVNENDNIRDIRYNIILYDLLSFYNSLAQSLLKSFFLHDQMFSPPS